MISKKILEELYLTEFVDYDEIIADIFENKDITPTHENFIKAIYLMRKAIYTAMKRGEFDE